MTLASPIGPAALRPSTETVRLAITRLEQASRLPCGTGSRPDDSGARAALPPNGGSGLPHGHGFMYRLGDLQLNLHGPGVAGDPNAAIPVVPGGSDLCFSWDGPIEAALEHLHRCGVEPELGPVDRFGARGAGRSVYFRDPDGSLLELISYRLD